MKIDFNNYQSSAPVSKKSYVSYPQLLSALSVKKDVINISEKEYALNIVKAGAGMFAPSNLIRRSQGFIDYYEDFFKVNNFSTANSFNKLTGYAYDPTYIGQFSNMIGKAHANILFKKLSRGWFTYNYEGWAMQMGIKLTGARPDLVGLNLNNQLFTIEAKGWSSKGTDAKKLAAVHQSVSVNVGQTAGIASISKDLYNKIEVDYIDPKPSNEVLEFSVEELKRNYYALWRSQITNRSKHKNIAGKDIIIFDYLRFLDNYYLIGIEKEMLENITLNLFNREITQGENYLIDGDGVGIFLVSDNDDKMTLENFISEHK